MGCASSTPMVATAGSDILKAASHVAGDIEQKADAAVQDVTEALNDTIDTAKTTMESAVSCVTNELGAILKTNGRDTMCDGKKKIMDGTHFGASSSVDADVVGPTTSRAPTPNVDDKETTQYSVHTTVDADSLKTSTPEPEIERALANGVAVEEASPPTPKPTLAELAYLSAEMTASGTDPGDSQGISTAADETISHVEHTIVAEQCRPNTTDWEKFADQLANSRKFKPYESFTHRKNQFSIYQDYTSLRDKPSHFDGNFSDFSLSQSSLSSAYLTPATLTPAPARRSQREFAKLVACEQPASISRASSRLSNAGTEVRRDVAIGKHDIDRKSNWSKPTSVAMEREYNVPGTTQRLTHAGSTAYMQSMQLSKVTSPSFSPIIAHRAGIAMPSHTKGNKQMSANISTSKPSNYNPELLAAPTPIHKSQKINMAHSLPTKVVRDVLQPVPVTPDNKSNGMSKENKQSNLIGAGNESKRFKLRELRSTNEVALLNDNLSSPIRASEKIAVLGEESATVAHSKIESRPHSQVSHSSSACSADVVICSTFNTPNTLSPDHKITSINDGSDLPSKKGVRGSSSLQFNTVELQKRTNAIRSSYSGTHTAPWELRHCYDDKENKPAFVATLNLMSPPLYPDNADVSLYEKQELCDICCTNYVIKEF